MSKRTFNSLFTSGLSKSELLIVMYLINTCNEYAFTVDDEKTIAELFNASIANIYKRTSNLKRLEIIKKVEYNGRCGYMINPIYSYHGPLHLKRFRVKLWEEGKIYSTSRPDRFYGPPVEDSEDTENS